MMKKLKDLLRGVTYKWISRESEIEIEKISFDSRNIASGDCFVAVVGTQSDGHNYIEQVVGKGAAVVVCEHRPETLNPDVCYVEVEDSSKALAIMARNYYDDPSRKLKLVGVTGTNGKTTTATLLYDLFRRLGYKVGLISTVVYRIDERTIPSTHTTPDVLRLNQMIDEMVECGCEFCFMEVSSHAIAQSRIEGLRFEGAIFTNITHDHLDFHHTFGEYISVKQQLFSQLDTDSFALVNIDDRNGRVMVQNSKAKISTLSLRSMADFRCKIIEMQLDGMLLQIGNDNIWVEMLGRFNGYNLLSVYGAAMLLGQDHNETVVALSALKSVSGRFESIISPTGITAIVDYAHTPDALESVLTTIGEIAQGNVYVVCGCGGDRDRTKRPEMATIAVKLSNMAIFTADNPRSESVDAILDDMIEGVQAGDKYLRIADRSEAIRAALMMATSGDVVLIAGKGHEDYQIVGGEKHHFDDREKVREVFGTMKKK